MAMDIYDSQYLLILAPTLVIALMFLFFWLFMKETSYDEVLARQKRDLKLPPTKPDSRKKNEKKKSKKKEAAGGGSGGGGGESEEDLRDFDLTDVIGSNVEAEEEPEPVVTPDPSPPAPAAEVSVSPETTSGLRERKKKEKKAAKAAAKAAAAAASNLEESEVNDSKPVSHKTETSPTSGKRMSPPPPQMETQVQVQAVQAPVQTQTPPQTSGKKKDRKKQKVESQAAHNDDIPPKASGKKQKNETDKNTEVKLKELLSGLSNLALSEAEAISVIALLREKNPSAVDAWHKSTARPDPAAQEREKLLVTLQEESSIAKDKVKQLSQELQLEKQKTGRMETMMREQRVAMEKELGGMQAKAQGSYQELQFQQVREQLEAQITRLQQENGILRDAVSSATTQMESRNSAELNKLRSEYAGLMKELADNNSKLQQEEHQRKSLEVSYKQNVSQLEQDAKRSWEELQNFLHNVNAEREKLQASKQLHSQLLAAESEMNNKNKELQTLHSNLNEAMLSKEQLERRVLELMEMSQRSVPDETVQAQVQELKNENKALQAQNEAQQSQNENLQAQISSQANHVSHIEELQKLSEKELQRKSLEDSLNAERSSGANRETNMQVQEKEENIKTVEGLLEKGLIEVANKEAKLKIQEKDVKLKSVEESLQAAQARSSTMEKTVEFSEKESQVGNLQVELAELKDALELHRKKNNELREKNWSAMEALSATESMLQGKLSKAVKESQATLAQTQAECRDVLHRLLPHVPLPSEQNHQEWLQRFETAVAESLLQELAEKLKEAEETQRILQKDCETYKKVLAETEGILQRLQSSVEEEESRWKVKLEQSQEDVRELRREKQHLESELERAENESATYVTEVRELKDLLTELQTRLDGSYTEAFRQNEELAVLKTQLSETLSRLETEEKERQRVAGDLYKAQQSLEQIQSELTKLIENTALIENTSLSSQREEIDKKERITAGLNQTVREMQQLLNAISQQLAKGQQG
uniref:Kinectin 1 n=1 Tax=Xiphophorus couchianus TaxID=32473 RepID=A0A3B5LKN1_9TELE